MTGDSSGRATGIIYTKSGEIKEEIRVIVMIMTGWLVAILGSQIAIWYMEKTLIEYWLSEMIYFNLPVHFWLSGQFLPLWFILLGVLFNYWMDRHETRRMESSIRFRSAGRSKEELRQ